MVHKIEDLVKPFHGDLNSIKENVLTQPFVINKENISFDDDEKAIHHKPVMDFHYQNCSDKYIIEDMDKPNFFNRQYFYYYRLRVEHFTPRIVENAKAMFGDSIEAVTLGDIRGDKKSLVIGCILKRMQNRMAVLKDFDKQNKEELEVRLHREDEMETLALETDFLELEDYHKQKVILKGNVDPYKFVTGLVVGIYGTQTENYFDVEKMVLPALPPYIERPLLGKDLYVVIASGFNVNNECPSILRELNYFSDIFCSEKYYNNIARIIFAGNNAITFCQKPCCQNTSVNNVMPIGLTLDADKTGSALAASSHFRRYFPHINLDMMPGETDPCSLMLPQQPLNNALFEDHDLPLDNEEFEDEVKKDNCETKIEIFEVNTESETKAGDFDASDYWRTGSSGICPGNQRVINPVTNPYCFKIMGIEFHGTSGQNVNSFRKLTKKRTPTLEIMRDIIETGHMIPTAPDFTDCFPYNRQDGKDPLALDQLPHVFFAGNQKEFASQMVDFGNNQKVRLVSIPKYEDTHSMVVINLRTLQTSQIVCKHRPV
uniref:DNA polymerase delta small subunit n=1 Tax=Panagrolaimus sp. ES5 TaxID=591445 RepID=A0AC34FE48_9BILA